MQPTVQSPGLQPCPGGPELPLESCIGAPEPEPGTVQMFAREKHALESVLEACRGGEGRAMVVLGESGVGKTTLLELAVHSATGFRVAMVAGVEAERDLAFAGLHRLCAPMMDRAAQLPAPQRDALTAAFGARGGEIERLFLGLAVLSLLAEVSSHQPLVCIIDDAQWIDRPSLQVIAFVARRLQTERIALVFAVREPTRELEGLPELSLDGISGAEAHALLASVVPGPVDVRMRDRIVADAKGNPRALLALSYDLAPVQFAGGFGVPAALPLPGRLAGSLRSQIAELPVQTQRLLLLVAAEPLGDPALVWRAAAQLRIEADAAENAESEGILEFGTRVTFRDPRMRSVVYHDARFDQRRLVHQALADAIPAQVDPDRWAWHRANATLAPDGEVADALERSASRASGAGDRAAAAAFLERSVQLTPDATRRANRALAAAGANFENGSLAVAAELLSAADAGPRDELERAQLQRLRARVALAQGLGADAPALFLDAARSLELIDARLAREAYLEALEALIFAGRLGSGSGLRTAAEAARAAPPTRVPDASDLLLDGLALLFTDGYASASSTLRQAVEAFSSSNDIRWRGLASQVAAALWDAEAMHALAASHVRLARDAGLLAHLPVALSFSGGLQVQAGRFAAAARLIEEGEAIAKAIGHVRVGRSSFVLGVWRGSDPRTAELLEASRRDALIRNDGRQLIPIEYAAGVLYNALGRYDDAYVAVRDACEREELFSCWFLPELIEAAARSGRRGLAVRACERLVEQTQMSNTEWALGIEARSLALVSEGRNTEKLYREAIDRLGRCPADAHLARAHLVYGEWLRRQRRRVDARDQLRIADEMFCRMGAAAFAARAHRELLATGEHVRKRTVETSSQLTARETVIAQLARDGDSNPQIAAKLFISARTVEYHLHKVFTKLGIGSRIQLAEVLHVDATPNAIAS